MLVANKKEIETVAALLEEGADSPVDLAKAVIKRLTELREERKYHALVFGLGPGVHVGFGPFATIDAAFNSVDKNPMAYIAKRAAVVPIYGTGQIAVMNALAEEPPAERGDWPEIRLDQQAVRKGWKGSMKDRHLYLTATT
jgi:hypothetical protein